MKRGRARSRLTSLPRFLHEPFLLPTEKPSPSRQFEAPKRDFAYPPSGDASCPSEEKKVRRSRRTGPPAPCPHRRARVVSREKERGRSPARTNARTEHSPSTRSGPPASGRETATLPRRTPPLPRRAEQERNPFLRPLLPRLRHRLVADFFGGLSWFDWVEEDETLTSPATSHRTEKRAARELTPSIGAAAAARISRQPLPPLLPGPRSSPRTRGTSL
jgi:hypothetical protein